MGKRVYFVKQEYRKDGMYNFVYLIKGDDQDPAGMKITVVVDGQWYDEELMRVNKLDIPTPKTLGVLIRYLANEALEQYDRYKSGQDDEPYIQITPDRSIDFDEIMTIARGEFPEVLLLEDEKSR